MRYYVRRLAFCVPDVPGDDGVPGVSWRVRGDCVYANLSDEAFSDVRSMTHGLAKSEGVRELSPGWRLGGTLGTCIKERAALKEQKNRS
jgi:hypothetical protein